MKNFFDNLLGLIIGIAFALFPAIVIAIVGFIFHRLGILDIAINAYDTIRFIIVFVGVISIVGVFLKGK